LFGAGLKLVRVKFHYTSWLGAGSEPIRSRFGAGSELVRSWSEPVRSMLATKFHYAVELASRSQTSLRPNSIKSWFYVKI